MTATPPPIEYCIPFTQVCDTITYWTMIIQLLGASTTLIVSIFGIYKIVVEIKKISNDREKSVLLDRTKFFLEQHRRLFDNSELFEVLKLIDGDNPSRLSAPDMYDKKRKFLAFFEEIELLVSSNLINQDVAYYMFGYYAKTARELSVFWDGLDPAEEHWIKYYNFVKGYEKSKAKLSQSCNL
jgi:hypothetical protein